MKFGRHLTFAILLSLAASSAIAADGRDVARQKYTELAAKVRSGDTSVDLQALRVAAAIGEVEDTSTGFLAVKNGYGALNDSKFQDALRIAREIEKQNIADVDAHYIAWRSLVELGRENESESERKLLAALLDSIMRSGDGKSAKTAWFAATIREEYMVMQAILNVQFQAQRTSMQDGHYYDVVAVTDKNGKQQVLWFNGDTEMHRQTAAGERAIHK